MLKKLTTAIIYLLLAVISVHAQSVQAQDTQQEAPTELPVILDARVTTTPERARLILDLSAPARFAFSSLESPMRIAVDAEVSSIKRQLSLTPAGKGLVSSVEIEIADAGRIRTWLVLAGPAQVQQAYTLDAFDDQPARLVVDLIMATEEKFATNASADLSRTVSAGNFPAKDNSNPPGTLQVELSTRPLIVIDPGHGGADSGAEAANGLKEKDIVLSFSKILQQLLVDSGRFDVALTREDDSFLRLGERVALARENQADLFISIHADYFQQEDVRGTSVYTRDETATDSLDKVLADNENKSDIVAGFAAPGTGDQVVSVLVDLMRREMRRQAFRAAESIVAQLQPSVTLRRYPVRKADFLVLQSPDVPSILIELGFLSNADDISNLSKGAWQGRVAEAIARGIATHFNSFAQR